MFLILWLQVTDASRGPRKIGDVCLTCVEAEMREEDYKPLCGKTRSAGSERVALSKNTRK
jgi:hypothetical protein